MNKADRTIEVLRSLFSRLGIFNQIVSDNGPQFTSDVYHQFCANNGICRMLMAPYHPQSNGGYKDRYKGDMLISLRKDMLV